MRIDVNQLLSVVGIVISCILVYAMFQINATLRLIYGVLDSGKIYNQVQKNYSNSYGKKESSNTPDPAIGGILKIDDSIYVTKVSSDNLVQNPNKNIGNTVSVKNDIDEDINKLKELKRGK